MTPQGAMSGERIGLQNVTRSESLKEKDEAPGVTRPLVGAQQGSTDPALGGAPRGALLRAWLEGARSRETAACVFSCVALIDARRRVTSRDIRAMLRAAGVQASALSLLLYSTLFIVPHDCSSQYLSVNCIS